MSGMGSWVNEMLWRASDSAVMLLLSRKVD